ncbi:MAG: class I SAM-dependent methyltransferase [Cyanobacteriota bacterium]
MSNNFDKIQEDFYSSAEVKRFYWQTENAFVKEKELELLFFFKDIIKPEDEILEVGCGECANIINLRSLGINNKFSAIDFSEHKIKFCQNLKLSNSEFIVSDARKLPFEDNKFNITFARDLLHHVNENRMEVIKELLRVTVPEGKVIIIEGNVQKFTNYVFASIFKHEQGMKDSTREKIESLLKNLNFTINSAEPSNFFRFILHYNIGIPHLAKFSIFRSILNLQENIFKTIIPKDNWAYWVIQIEKD